MSSDSVSSSEQLANMLMDCAVLVRQGDRSHPLLRQTMHILTDFVTAAPPPPTPPNVSPTPSTTTSTTPTNENTAQIATTTLHKPVKPQLGMGQIGKMMGMADEPLKTDVQKQATSSKNASRVKAEMEQAHLPKKGFLSAIVGTAVGKEDGEWCEEHFTMGCACKRNKKAEKPTTTVTAHGPSSATQTTNIISSSAGTATITTSRTMNSAKPSSKPAFQRPKNPKSPLIANGWIEQQRRSKMRTVWKDVLASLVEGRKPGQETTLWIQREVFNASTGKTELEALHQIPVKWLEDIQYAQYSTDHRFTLKVHNLSDEFIFRCPASEEAAQHWVLTLRSMQQLAQKKHHPPQVAAVSGTTGLDEWEKVPRGGEKKEVTPTHADPKLHQQHRQQQQHNEKADHRKTVTELRAIAHGAGVQTAGLERSQLEAIVQQIAAQGTFAALTKQESIRDEEMRLRAIEEARKRQEAAVEAGRRKAEEEKRAKEEAEQRVRLAERAREQHIAEQRKKEDEEHRKLAEERQRRDDEEIRRRLAEKQAEDQRRKQEEVQREQQLKWQQQQQAWQRQHAEEEQRKRAAEQQAAEERRRQEEAYRRQQQLHPQKSNWQQQPSNGSGPSQPQQFPQQQWQGVTGTQPGYLRTPQQPGFAQAAPGANSQNQQGFQQRPPQQFPAGEPRPNQQPQGETPSPINDKYAKMANQTPDDGQRTMSNIKHGILVQWALVPPKMQVLRPISELIISIQNVFPPNFGVPRHEYFTKWSPITAADFMENHRPDDAKLKKVMRKLRFFLHPDKLPKDLNAEQEFMCRMLWDIVSDAEADWEKREEDLGWVRG
jgi:hypothetical protein